MKCKICKKTFEKLIIHHIDGDHKNNNIKNRILICNQCHSKIHKGINYYTTRRLRVNMIKNLERLRNKWIDSKFKKVTIAKEQNNERNIYIPKYHSPHRDIDMKKLIEKKRIRKVIDYGIVCPECGRVIWGANKKGRDYNYNVHLAYCKGGMR